MSRVYFHSPSGTAELLGSERAWASRIVEDIATGVAAPRFGDDVDRMLAMIPAGHYLHGIAIADGGLGAWQQAFDTAWRVELDLVWRGHRLDSWTISLNTALVLGNDPVRFLAVMHGQCEIHGWVEGWHRAWLADIIERGLALGFYRVGMGWDQVVELLRRRNDEPVVMSYSVCDQFPNARASDWLPPWPEGVPENWDALSEDEQRSREGLHESWYDLPGEEKWQRGMRWLRSQPGGLEMNPDDWSDFRFGHRLSAFDLIAGDRDDRLNRALSGRSWDLASR